jgi:hypothetical protein
MSKYVLDAIKKAKEQELRDEALFASGDVDFSQEVGNIGTYIKGGIEDVTGLDIDDPTDRKKTAKDIADLYRQQMESGQEQWGKYLGEFSGLGAMGRDKATEYFGHDYGAMMPTPERYESGLAAEDYYYPDAQRYQFDPFDVEADPAYQFAKEQGLGQIERRAAAGSGALGPATMKEMAGFTTGLASQYGQQAFDRWQQEQGMKYGAGRDYRGDVERGVGQRYGVDIGERGFDYGAGRDYYGDLVGNVMDKYNIGAGQAGMGMNLQAMRNPLGFMGQQMQGTQGLASARQMQGGPAIWDWLNLGVQGAGAAAPFI